MKRLVGVNVPGRFDSGLYRGRGCAAIWAFVVVLGRWWGLIVRWDPHTLGSKVMWTFADLDFGWPR